MKPLEAHKLTSETEDLHNVRNENMHAARPKRWETSRHRGVQITSRQPSSATEATHSHEHLLDFCHDTYEGDKPAAFSTSPMNHPTSTKKGDLERPQNYRGITLSHTIYTLKELQRNAP